MEEQKYAIGEAPSIDIRAMEPSVDDIRSMMNTVTDLFCNLMTQQQGKELDSRRFSLGDESRSGADLRPSDASKAHNMGSAHEWIVGGSKVSQQDIDLVKSKIGIDPATFSSAASSSSAPSSSSPPSSLASTFALSDAPFEGGFDALAKWYYSVIAPTSTNIGSSGQFAYFSGGGIFTSALADFMEKSYNRYVGVSMFTPGQVAMESTVIKWMSSVVGYDPETSFGLLLTGSSMALLIAIITARDLVIRPKEWKLEESVLYCSEMTHHCVPKSALLAGFLPSCVRKVPVLEDGTLRINVEVLKQMIAEDLAKGLHPFMLIGNAGTTNTGTVDDLEALRDVAVENSLWYHVDGAYGGVFAMTERGKKVLKGMEAADSISLDPHKSLFLPYGTGALMVKNRQVLHQVHSGVSGAYMPQKIADDLLVDFCEMGPELSRDARGFRLWLPLKLGGTNTFRAYLNEKLTLARWAYDELKKVSDFIFVAGEPHLTVNTFRCAPAALEGNTAKLNALNAAIVNRVNSWGRTTLSPTTIRGYLHVRICVLCFRTRIDDVAIAVADILRAREQVLAEAHQ